MAEAGPSNDGPLYWSAEHLKIDEVLISPAALRLEAVAWVFAALPPIFEAVLSSKDHQQSSLVAVPALGVESVELQ